MLKIENIDKFKTMLCNGKVAHKVDITPNGANYVFYFRVSDFTPKVRKAYRLLGNDVEVYLERYIWRDGKYRIFVMFHANTIQKMVELDELQKPHQLATIVAKLLDKLQRIC